MVWWASTQAAAWEHAADGVRVNAVAPGFFLTPLLEKNLDQPTLDFSSYSARIAATGHRAELVGWLANDASSFVTGPYYAVDGGYLAR